MRFAAVVAAFTLAACGSGGDPQPTPSSTPSVVPTPTSTATATASPTAEPGGCTAFGSTSEASSDDPLAMSSLVGASMRVGRHDCYERFVFEMTGSGDVPGWSVEYTDPFIADPTGNVVELKGEASLQVIVRVWTVNDFEGRPAEWPPFTGPDVIVTSGFVAIQEARTLYAFEGVTQIGLGLDEQRPFRVSWLDGPPRLVVDVYTGESLD